jgi:tetratricopeptide (TPR) repeat protein
VNSTSKQKNSASNSIQYLYLLLCVVSCLSIYLSQTRSVLLASAAALLAILLYLNLFANNTLKTKVFYVCFLKVFISSALIIFITYSFTISSNNFSERLNSTSLAQGSISARFLIWKQVITAINERPWLGWGHENLIYMGKYYVPGLWFEPWQDRAHNIFLEVLSTSGFLGLVAYCAVVCCFLQIIFSRENRNSCQYQKAFLCGGSTFYLVNNLFIFDNITSFILLYGLLAFATFTHLEIPSCNSSHKKLKEVSLLRFIIPILLILIGGTSLIWNLYNVKLNIALQRIVNSTQLFYLDQNQKPKLFIEDFLERKFIGHTEAVEQLLLLAIRAAKEQTDMNAKEYIFNVAERAIKEELVSDPKKTYFIYYSGNFYLSFGKFELAEAQYIEALKQSPNNQHILMSLGNLYLNKKNYAQALPLLKKAAALDASFILAQKNYLQAKLEADNQN